MKKLIRSIFALFILFCSVPTMAAVGLSDEEGEYLSRQLTGTPAQRAENYKNYWNVYIEAAVAEYNARLPERLSQTTVWLDVEHLEKNNRHAIAYTYEVPAMIKNMAEYREILAQDLCSDPSTAMLLVTFKGALMFVYTVKNQPTPQPQFHFITANDCGTGI
jgi:hypothetical protein